MPLDWSTIEYFKSEEFDDPLHPGSGEAIDPELVHKLDILRGRIKKPIIIHGMVGGAVDVAGNHGHSKNSYHLAANGCKAADFHFKTYHNPRQQYLWVESMQFNGVGVYYCWHWDGKLLPIGFHVDVADDAYKRPQRWVCREKGNYVYLLGR